MAIRLNNRSRYPSGKPIIAIDGARAAGAPELFFSVDRGYAQDEAGFAPFLSWERGARI